MSNDPNKRQVRIVNSKTGAVRLSEPVSIQPTYSSQAATPDTSDAPRMTESVRPDQAQPVPSKLEETSAPTTPATSETVANPSASAESTSKGKGTAGSKPKVDIETLEQFIAYAFSRKGQRIKLSSKVERLIAQEPRLDDAAMARLRALAAADATLAVLRQLLLVSREVQGLPALRAAIAGFVSSVMQQQPVFADAGVQAALRNLPEAPPLEVALRRVAGYEPTPTSGKDELKPAELQALRHDAVQLFAVWLASNRSLNSEDLSKLLFQVVWAPAARELEDDNARLRALTEIEQTAGVGLACDKFRQSAIEAGAACDQAQREASGLRESVAELRARLEQTEAERAALVAELQALKESSANEMAQVRKQHEAERMHLRHDLEQLRGRLVRRLSDSIEMLEVGLTALRNKTPRTEVMAERAEHVIDALRSEESYLREG